MHTLLRWPAGLSSWLPRLVHVVLSASSTGAEQERGVARALRLLRWRMLCGSRDLTTSARQTSQRIRWESILEVLRSLRLSAWRGRHALRPLVVDVDVQCSPGFVLLAAAQLAPPRLRAQEDLHGLGPEPEHAPQLDFGRLHHRDGLLGSPRAIGGICCTLIKAHITCESRKSLDFVPLAAGRAHGLVVGRHGPGAVHRRCKASGLLNLEMLCAPVRKPLNCSPPAHSLVDVKQLMLSMYLRQSLLPPLLSLALRNVLLSILQECLTHLSRRCVIICILGCNRLRQLERLEVLAVHWVALSGRLCAKTLV